MVVLVACGAGRPQEPVLASSGGTPQPVPDPVPEPKTIAITPASASLVPGGSLRLTATVTGVSDTRVRFSTDSGAVDPGTGLFTAALEAGVAHVTAESLADPTLQAGATITIAADGQVYVRVQPDPVELAPGDVARLVATVTGTSDSSVTWSIEEGSAGGTIDGRGQYQAPAGEGTWHVVARSVADPSATGSATVISSVNLRDLGGPIAPEVNVTALFWGDPGAFPGDERAAMESLLGQIDGTPYLALIDQYMRGGKARARFAGTIVDPESPPAAIPDYGQISAQVCGQIAKAGRKPDPSDLYLVYLATGAPQTGFCAYHSSTTCDGVRVLFSLVPNPVQQGNCSFVGHLQCNGWSTAAQSAATFTVHELVETMTDPVGGAWTGPGHEVADKCYTEFPACVPVGTSGWELQAQWSNAAHACVVP